MLWKLFQIAVFFAVFATSVEYGWGKDVSGLAVGAVCAGAAFLATVTLSGLFSLMRKLSALLLGSNHRAHNRRLTW